ncbi:MAG: DedA family protein [Candidatus Pelagibacter sp. TMED153]|nr:MAG: DedA family protein [Candidatus Pelagibacter sp. TMED153]|tara:strand:+ start:1806 stop:2558 length:753 start_codon:yes stop_codon:yes gene_type:complete
MRIKLKIFLGISYLLILLTFLYFFFSAFEISRLNDFSYYKELQVDLENYIGNNLYRNLLLFFIFSIAWVMMFGFGSPILLVSGILFGKWLGTFVSVISISIGTLGLYIIATFFFAELVNNLFKERIKKYINLFRKNEFYYFLIFRLAGGLGFPFPIQNILPVIFNMSKINYFFSSLLGFIPQFFIWNTIGSGLNDYIQKSNDFNLLEFISSKEIYLPLILFLILILISVAIKKKFFDDKIDNQKENNTNG